MCESIRPPCDRLTRQPEERQPSARITRTAKIACVQNGFFALFKSCRILL
jgi:hypothetical protein